MKLSRMFGLVGLCLFLSYFPSVSQTVDPSFQLPAPIASANISGLIVQGDGKVLVSGNINYYEEQKINHLVRVNPDGSVDNSFSFTHQGIDFLTHLQLLSTGDIIACFRNKLFKISSMGEVLSEIELNRSITSTNIQADDKIVITTSDLWTADNSGHVYRYHPDLTLDETYSQNINTNGWIFDADLQGDRLIITGLFTEINGIAKNELARLNTDGSLDASFDVGTGTGAFYALITVAPSEKIFLSNAYFSSFNGQPVDGTGLLCLNADGTLNTSFNASGVGSTNGKPIFQEERLFIKAHLNLGDLSGDYLFLVTKEGTLDTSFAPLYSFGRHIQKFTLDNENNVIFNNVDGLGKLLTDGQIDLTFQTSLGRYGLISSGDYQDGHLIIGGDFIRIGGVKTSNVAKIDSYGHVDPKFQFSTSILSFHRQPTQITYRHSDTVMVAFDEKLVWLNHKGDTIQTFQPEVSNPYHRSFVEHFEVLSRGKVVSTSGNGTFLFNADGSGDFLQIRPDTEISGGRAPLALQSKGILHEVLINNNGNRQAYLNRLNFDGLIDTSFDTVSVTRASFLDIEVLPNDDIIAVGNFDQYGDVSTRYLVKLLSDGQIDTTFTTNFYLTAPEYSKLNYCTSFQNGFIVAGSQMNTPVIGVLNSDGTYNTDYILPAVVDSVESLIFPLVINSDEVFLLSTFQRGDQSEPSFALKLAFNEIPIIKGTTVELTTPYNTPLTLSLDSLVVADGNSTYPDEFLLHIQPGEHYTIDGTTVVPDSSFVGTLSVPVVVNDGKHDSDPYLLSVSVGSPEPVSVRIQIDSITSEQAFVQFVFSEPVSVFTLEDVMVSNGILTALTTSDSTIFSATLSAVDDSIMYISVPKDRVRGLSGQENAASDTVAVTFPAIAPDAFRLALTVDRSSTTAPLTATLYHQQQDHWHMDTTLTVGTSSFTFPALPSGIYTLRLQSIDTSLLTSYLGEALTLSDAHPIALAQDTAVSLRLLNRPTPATIGGDGTATIAGVLRQGSTENGRLLIRESVAKGEPIPSVAVYLLSEEEDVVAFTMTDANGYFRFKGLAVATYRLRADYDGLSHDTSLDQITVQHAQETVQLSLVAGNTLALDSITRQEQQDQITALLPSDEPTILQYYPNPVVDQLTVTGLPVGFDGKVELQTILGTVVKQQPITRSSLQWNLSKLPMGVYILIVRHGPRNQTFRLQKK